jgi:hypothetical protein
MPTEKAPNNPLSQNYVPVGGTPYRVKTGDDWQSVARTAGVDVWALIEFNFKTRNPAEVNWYLRRNVGCRRATGDNKNWMFSSDAATGNYLPSFQFKDTSVDPIDQILAKRLHSSLHPRVYTACARGKTRWEDDDTGAAVHASADWNSVLNRRRWNLRLLSD